MTMTTDQLVTAAAAAKATLTTAQQATATARTAWHAATTLCGMERSHRAVGRQSVSTPPVTVVPSPMPDFATLALNLTTAVVAENVAAEAYSTARTALNAALANT